MDGSSLLKFFKEGTDAAHQDDEVHCWELYGRIGVRKGDWKAEFYDAPYGTGEWELYHLKTDPGEHYNLADMNTEKLNELKADWDKYVSEYGVVLPDEKTSYGVDDFWRSSKGQVRTSY